MLQRLLDSEEPSLRYKVRVGVLGKNHATSAMRALREEIRRSPRVRALLAGCHRAAPYQKWRGAHWVLASLADPLGYPPGNRDARCGVLLEAAARTRCRPGRRGST